LRNLTNEQKRAIAEQAKIELARRSLEDFLIYESGGTWKTARHLKLLCSKLEAIERGEIRRLMVFMPPRHGKSEVVSKKFPAWYLGRNPHKEVIEASYAADLAYDFSRIARDTLKEWGPKLWGVDVAEGNSGVTRWGIKDTRGGFTAAGVGGPITGRGAHLAIIDDPFKNWEEAQSKVIRDKVFEWYRSTLRTRLAPGGAIVLVLTRWHEDDLAGRLLKLAESGEGERWEVISLPAVAEDENDAIGRKPGEVLWPERFPPEEYEQMKKAVGSHIWIALYQQRPRDLDGGAFKPSWFKWYTKNEISFHDDAWWYRDERMTLYQGVDPAISEKESADDFVIATVGVTESNKILLLDIYHGHLEFTEQVKMIIKKYQEWLPERVGIETNAYQRALKQEVIRRAMIPVKGLNHVGDKYTRIMTMTPFFENGQFYMRQALDNEPGWIDMSYLPHIRIHEKFRKTYEQMINYGPKAAHDDILDAIQNTFEVGKLKMVENEYFKYVN
jgi:predicted phage terminase large subunit-like protein